MGPVCSALLLTASPGAAIGGPPQVNLTAVEQLPLGLPADLEAAAVILQAEDTRTLDEALLRLTRTADPALRARAALAVGRIGLPAGYPRLVELASDRDPAVRALAAFGLGLLELDLEPATVGANRRRIVERLIPLLQDAEPLVAAQALWALGAQPDAAAVPPVLDVLADPQRAAAVLQAALDAWWRLPGASREPIEPYLRADDPALRRAAATALRRLDDPNAMPALAAALGDPDPAVRVAAIRGLEGAPPAVIRGRLTTLVSDRDWRVAAAALQWVAALWRADADIDDEVFRAVLTASGDRNRHLQRLAFAALVAAPGKFSVPEDRLVVALRSGDTTTRTAAVASLGADGRAGEAFDAMLEVYGLARPPREASAAEIPPLVRENPIEAAAVAGALGASDDDVAGDWLRLLATHGPTAARAEALRRLRERAPGDAAALAATWLVEETPVLRAVAGEVVRELAAVGGLPRRGEDETSWADLLWNAQREVGEAGALEPRLLLLDALQSVDPELLQFRAAALFPDPDRVVRLWALRNLAAPQRRGDEMVAAAAGPLETGRTAADYRRLAAAVRALEDDPPSFAVETERGTFVWRLRADWAPLTAVAYLQSVRDGFYDGLVFHRVVPDFVIQTGDPTAVGSGGARGSLRSEETPIAYHSGTVGLALAGRDTGGSQFFITDSEQPHLRGRYPVLGRVIGNPGYVARIQPGDRLSISIR
ncbi:MAG: peptidylprolyl isomerase [Acidobacteriota bacterium]